MDRNTIIGLTLIFILFVVWQQFVAPSPEEVEAQRRLQDSLAQVARVDSLPGEDSYGAPDSVVQAATALPDSVRMQQLSGTFGPFADAASGKEDLSVLENELFVVTFTNKGGRIVGVELKEYDKVLEDENRKEFKIPARLLENEKNRFEYFLPLANLPGGGIRTSELYFEVIPGKNSLVFRAGAGPGRYLEQTYTIQPGTYEIQYDIRFKGLNNILPGTSNEIQLYWENYLDKLEINTNYERNYSTVYFKTVEGDPDYLSQTKNDKEEIEEPIKWISNSNQFFNSSLIAGTSFSSADLEVQVPEAEVPYLKKIISTIRIPYGHSADESFGMVFYVGPNEFDRLMAVGDELEDVIPFGWSIFGTINRWVIRPIFNFLSRFISSKGLVILALTLIVKLLLFPLTYRMLYSQSKMGALKPQLESLREKYKEDPQQQQMEQMKIYREFGVNPLGGCMPMVLQMPIWFALYRFFPASIEFRQAGFLWANDLSSYDAFIKLPFEIPLGFGAHISLFTVLWAVTTLVYTYYNTKDMDMSANPAMKYMQYLMPIFFVGFFNGFASGLTAYLLFSNLINITQTIVTKKVIIDQEKIKEELEAYRKKPKKKKGGFQQRLEQAMKEQQRIQAEREASKKKGSRGKN